ncbi:MAG: AAA family ATPase [Lachnospiraceae bacterium]|nr:AAA family ATPase [Lachnospiraceae bacterium]
MGIYLNPGKGKFEKAINSEIYVDKSMLINVTNRKINTLEQNICISRPRRFGKSMAANMLTAYYSKGCDSKELFQGLKIAQMDSFEKHLNQYDVVFLNMQEFLSRTSSMQEMLELLKKSVVWDLLDEYPNFRYFDTNDIIRTMQDVYRNTHRSFVFIIDEWDCIFREYKNDKEAQEKYLDFMRDMLKDKEYVALAYMTGILPIKKYGTHSALNMFNEYSMLEAGTVAEFVGFTQSEVEDLCNRYGMNIEDVKEWYDGYYFDGVGAIYNPRSVVCCMQFQNYNNYWNQTETFEALRVYIDMNFEGLKDDVISMIAGNRVRVNTGSFVNDMTSLAVKDDVYTLLIHLGYLAYDLELKQAYIPNNEVRQEFINCVSVSDWGEVSKALKNSADTLQAIWENRPSQVSLGIEQAHFETSHIQYNDENALSYTISLALYAARNFYTIYRELPTEKGFADMVYLPRKKFADKPAIVVELKWDKSAEGAIAQIKNKQYVKSLQEYEGNILLVGVNYNKDTREHECVIEEWEKRI